MNCQDVIIPYQIANATAQSLINYVESRKDMMLHLFRQLTNAASVADIVAWRNATGAYTGGTQFDSNYVALYAGSVKVTDPLSNTSRFILPGGDLAAALSLNDTGGGRLPEGESGTWLAPAGETRARLAVDGVQYDVGASGNSSFLRSLGDDNHINAIHRFDGKVIIGDAFTLWRSTTLTQWTNVRRLMIFTEVRIARLIQKYMYEPNNPVLWRKIYNKIKPFMDRMVGLGAFFEYRYDGDQDASGLSDAKVNSPDDITNGVFRCRLYVKPVPPARELKVEFIITKLSASFTEQLS
jgi:phage tail sheath protein FI